MGSRQSHGMAMWLLSVAALTLQLTRRAPGLVIDPPEVGPTPYRAPGGHWVHHISDDGDAFFARCRVGVYRVGCCNGSCELRALTELLQETKKCIITGSKT